MLLSTATAGEAQLKRELTVMIVLIGYSSAWLIAKSIDLLVVRRTASASSVTRG